MMVRMWSATARPEMVDAYVEHLRAHTFAALKRIPGYFGANVLRRRTGASDALMVLTLWESEAAIRAFAGEDVEAAVVPPEAQRFLLTWDARAVHWPMAYNSFDREDA